MIMTTLRRRPRLLLTLLLLVSCTVWIVMVTAAAWSLQQPPPPVWRWNHHHHPPSHPRPHHPEYHHCGEWSSCRRRRRYHHEMMHRRHRHNHHTIITMMMTSIDNHHWNSTTTGNHVGEGINGDSVSVRPIEVSRSSITTAVTHDHVPMTTNGVNHEKHFGDDSSNAFDLVAQLAGICLYQSHFRRNAMNPKNDRVRASSATNWIDEASAKMLQQAMDRLTLLFHSPPRTVHQNNIEYIRWFKSVPFPAVMDLSTDVRHIINTTFLTDDSMWSKIDETRSDFLSRLQCRLWWFPSGTALPCPLLEPPATLVFGKLLYGGLTRYRRLGTPPQRRVGVRTDVQPTIQDPVPTFLMYGGVERMYESVDMGPAALLEVILYPRGQEQNAQQFTSHDGNTMMQLLGVTLRPQSMFTFDQSNNETSTSSQFASTSTVTMLPSGSRRNEAFRDGMQSSIGGLQPQIDTIVRRVLDGRVIRPATESDLATTSTTMTMENTTTTLPPSTASCLEAEELQLLGLTPVRGLLLYGPPGCGKTALAREISRALRARAPKIVSAPELLDRWVGGSEKLVRQLFADAEAELAACNNDATKSALHVIVIDEIDAVFRKRTSSEDTGEATRSSVVNQILSKLDGVKAIGNILVIGMTNRRELLDEALLRPGRLEVQIEIPLPNQEGRREILNVHFQALRQRGRLSQPLCLAIDGVHESTRQPLADTKSLTRRSVERLVDPIVPITPSSVFNFATDSISNNMDVVTNAISDNIMFASDVLALDAISFPPGAIITDFVRLVRRAISRRRRNGQNARNGSGSAMNGSKDLNDNNATSGRRRTTFRSLIRRWIPRFRATPYDLASDRVTGGFSGADIAGLVRCAGSLALARARREGYGIGELLITLEDVKAAVKEVRPK